MDEKTLFVIDNDGHEKEMNILFTFEDDSFNKKYVLYFDPADETGEVFVSSYTEDGELLNIEDETEWAMIEEVFGAFVDRHDHAHCGPDCDHHHDEEIIH